MDRADDVPLTHILDHFGDNVRVEGDGVDLAIANHAAIGDELEKNPVAPAEVGRRHANNKGLD